MKKFLLPLLFIASCFSISAQINTDKVLMIGQNALYYEDYVLAIQYFNQVIQVKPYLAEPYYYRAVSKYLLEDNNGAEEDCSLCIQKNPFVANVYALRADARLNLNNLDGAIADYLEAKKNDPENKTILLKLGFAYSQKKEFPKAETDFNLLISLYPTYTQGLLARGQMFLQKGDTINAISDCTKAVSLDKYYPQSYSLRGLIYYYKKDYLKSISDYDEAIKLDPLNNDNYINRGLARYSTDDFRGAMADYNHVAEKEPNNIIAHLNRGLLRAEVGENKNAIADFNVVLAHEPSNYIAYLNRSILYAKIGKYSAALTDLNKVLAQYPTFYQGFYNRSDIKRRQGDIKGAEKDIAYARQKEKQILMDVTKGKKIKEKTRMNSDNTINEFNLLVVADQTPTNKPSKYTDKSRGRIQDQQVKIKLEPQFLLTYYIKLDQIRNSYLYNPLVDKLNTSAVFNKKIYLSNNESKLTEQEIQDNFASITNYSNQIAQDKTNEYLYFARGIAYLLVQNLENAKFDFEKVVALNPSQTLAFFSLGVVHSKMAELRENGIDSEMPKVKMENLTSTSSSPLLAPSLASVPLDTKTEKTDYLKAIDYFSKVIALDPQFASAYYNRGQLESQQKNYQASISDYSHAIGLNPDLAEAYYNRGLDYLWSGNKKAGLADLRKAGEKGIANAYSIVKGMSAEGQ